MDSRVASVRAGDDSMNKTRMMTDKHNSPARRCGRLILRNRKCVTFVGCLVVSLILTATSASAHVKWFVVCNVSDTPLPIGAVFTTTFVLCAALFLILFYFACEIEQTSFGAAISRALNHRTECLHRRTDDLLRAVAAVSFALLWADGGLILTPELKGSSTGLSVIQLLVPTYLIARATVPAAGAGILVLYGYSAVTYGPFHMLDYPLFIGLGAYFALSVSQNAKLLAIRFDALRWAVALSLLWPSMEKFVYPAWVAPIAITHPELTLGFDVNTVVTAAGVVEFGLAFALFWTPLVRRLAALALMLLLTAATFDFGKVDGIGHLMIIAILLLVFADPGREQPCCRPVLAPLVSSATWLATIFLYTGGHALYYGSRNPALVAIAGGAATLGFIYLCLQGRTLLWSPMRARSGQPSFVDRAAERSTDPSADAHGESQPHDSPARTWADVARTHAWRNAGTAGDILRGAINRYRSGDLWGAFSNRTQIE
jgi:hypothetical protein